MPEVAPRLPDGQRIFLLAADNHSDGRITMRQSRANEALLMYHKSSDSCLAQTHAGRR